MIDDVKREVWGRVRRQLCPKAPVLLKGRLQLPSFLGKLEI